MDNQFRTIYLDAGTYLYNLKDDSGEHNNLADNYPKKIEELYQAHERLKKNLQNQ